MTHDPRLVAQCAALPPHDDGCRCDCCRILRGEPTHWPRVYVEGASMGGHPDSDAPWRRTIVGRVVRLSEYVGRVFNDDYSRTIGWMVNVRAPNEATPDVFVPIEEAESGRAAERRALEAAG